MKNFLNDSYSRDISIKVRSNFESRRRDGEFVSNYTTYGYLRDPKNKNRLIVDERAGEVVRDIFRWKIEGMSPVTIADKLNARGILSPSEYKRSISVNFKTPFQTKSRSQWSAKAVGRILTNEIYTGVLVQGKRTTPNHKIKKVVVKDESEWSRMENAHEAIISLREYRLVQRLIQEDGRRAMESETVHPLSGRVYCGTCGSPAKRRVVTDGGKKYVYYGCPSSKTKGGCAKRNISESELEAAVLATLQTEIKLILDMERALKQTESLAWERREISRLEASIAAQETEIQKYKTLKTSTYEDLRDGLIDQEEFLQMKEDFSRRIKTLEGDMDILKAELSEIRGGLSNRGGWLTQFRQYQNITRLDRTIIVNLVDKVELYPGKKLTVSLLYEDQIANMMAFLKEQRAARPGSKKEAS